MNIVQALEARWKGRKGVDALTIAPTVQDAVGAKSAPIPAVLSAPPIAPSAPPAEPEHE